MQTSDSLNRRRFLKSATIAATVAASGSAFSAQTDASCQPVLPSAKIPLGFDNFSIRAHNWKADRLLDFAIEQKLDSLLLSDLDVYQDHSAKHLASLKAKASDSGIVLHAGTGGICSTAARFIKKWGTATEHLKLGIRIARDLGSPVFRCYLGGSKDRLTNGGIQSHIDETIKSLKSVESFAVDSNIKIAVENHAGDMQADELVGLINEAGKHFVGATIDSGNATWTLESPLENLKTLGPYAISSGMRDSTIWSTDKGAKVAWNAVGEGQVDWQAYAKLFASLCPGVPFQLETISGFNREIAFKTDGFWQAYPDAKAADFESFLKMARSGKPVPKGKSNDPTFQMTDLMNSIKYCKQELGMGLKE